MPSETTPSEQTILDERIAGFWNDILDFCGNHRFIVFILLFIAIIIIITLFCRKKFQITSLIPFEVAWRTDTKSSTHPKRKIDRLITDTPPSAPRDKKARLPLELRGPDRHLKLGERQRILIHCDNHILAEEYGKIWFHKLYEQQDVTYNYIGWVDYEKKRNQTKYPEISLAACFYSELWYLREEYSDPDVRYSKQLDYFKDPSNHTILFINILEFPEWIVRDLGRHNNLPGLSIILISNREIDGYETYKLPPIGGDM